MIFGRGNYNVSLILCLCNEHSLIVMVKGLSMARKQEKG